MVLLAVPQATANGTKMGAEAAPAAETAPASAAPAAAATRGGEDPDPSKRGAAPDSVADGPTLAPGALGFAGAAAPAVTDQPFLGRPDPSPAQ